jgi:hypothetical protein
MKSVPGLILATTCAALLAACAAQSATFGIDPQARLDHGWQAVAAVTPMGKEVIRVAYGRGPDRSRPHPRLQGPLREAP